MLRSRLESILNVAGGYASGASIGCGLADSLFEQPANEPHAVPWINPENFLSDCALGPTMWLWHPPVRDSHVPLGRERVLVGWIALAVFVLTFAPVPFSFH